MTEAHIAQARKNYHADLLRSVLTINKNGVPTNADKDSKLSVRIARGIAEQLESTTGERLVCLSSEKLTTMPTELLTTPLWNIWAVYPFPRSCRGLSVSLTSSAIGQYLGGV